MILKLSRSKVNQKKIIFSDVYKLFVGFGVSRKGYTQELEIIDVTNPKNFCLSPLLLPNHLEKMSAAVFDEGLVISGMFILLFYKTILVV